MAADQRITGILLATGTHAARPAANTVMVGTLYPESDTALVYQSDGTNWNLWATLGTGSPLTTKGDIYVHSTVDTRLPVGANGTKLTADSTQTTGVKWA